MNEWMNDRMEHQRQCKDDVGRTVRCEFPGSPSIILIYNLEQIFLEDFFVFVFSKCIVLLLYPYADEMHVRSLMVRDYTVLYTPNFRLCRP
jgi:hypothetical protein